MKILSLLALSLPLVANLQAEEARKPSLSAIIGQSAFCVAYVIRDADARDARPNDPNDPIPDASGEKIPSGAVLGSESLIDVAALASRVTAQARIGKDQLAAVCKAVVDGHSRFLVMACYEPHHAIVFYSQGGKPVCCIEICFTCSRIKVATELESSTLSDNRFEGADLVSLARVFSELKLPLAPFESFEALKRQKEAELQESLSEDKKDFIKEGDKPAN